jgi:hypothetical protein
MTFALNRRAFLRGTGVCLALPCLDAMRPARANDAADVPRRMVTPMAPTMRSALTCSDLPPIAKT